MFVVGLLLGAALLYFPPYAWAWVGDDYVQFDYVLAMDRDNYSDLLAVCPTEQAGKLRLFLEFAPEAGTREVPDPYYGGGTGFERVLDLVELAALGLLAELRQQYRL